MPTYNPPTTPNVILDFTLTPYTPPTTPNVILDFGATEDANNSGPGSGTIETMFFALF